MSGSKLGPTIAEHWAWQVERNPFLKNLPPEDLERTRRVFFAGAGSVVEISIKIAKGDFGDQDEAWGVVCAEIGSFYQNEAKSLADAVGCSTERVQRLHKQRVDAINRGEPDPWTKPEE